MEEDRTVGVSVDQARGVRETKPGAGGWGRFKIGKWGQNAGPPKKSPGRE